jgi:hypothetical protein
MNGAVESYESTAAVPTRPSPSQAADDVRPATSQSRILETVVSVEYVHDEVGRIGRVGNLGEVVDVLHGVGLVIVRMQWRLRYHCRSGEGRRPIFFWNHQYAYRDAYRVQCCTQFYIHIP